MLIITMDFGDSATLYDADGTAIARVHLLRKRKSRQYYVGIEAPQDIKILRDAVLEQPVRIGEKRGGAGAKP